MVRRRSSVVPDQAPQTAEGPTGGVVAVSDELMAVGSMAIQTRR